jgi:hypothetical protein
MKNLSASDGHEVAVTSALSPGAGRNPASVDIAQVIPEGRSLSGRAMESIYYVISWLCHRRCRHCYDDRFRPYVRGALKRVVEESLASHAAIVDHLPESMIYRDIDDPDTDGAIRTRRGRIILSGGEVLVDPIREPVLYPILERLERRYRDNGGVNVVIQTTGDHLDELILEQLLRRGVWSVSVAGMDDFHAGMEGDKKLRRQEQLTALFERLGMRRSGHRAGERKWTDEDGPLYSFFGANPDTWIGKLWPRGRAWENGLSTATLADNFCNAWSGGLNFLRYGFSGSEVSIEPNGNVYPCCMKTRLPLGNLVEEPLIDILASLQGHPVFEAISNGHPERMGLGYGWDVARFYEMSQTLTPDGRPYRNLCIGCDRFYDTFMSPVLEETAERRRRARRAA